MLGCDLQSRPDDAAFDVLIGKDIFDKSVPWRLPAGETKESLELYSLIEANFIKALDQSRLDPLVYNLDSAYECAVYSHGKHTSRAPTCYSAKRRGMYDHVIFNANKLQMTKILEIPDEQDLAPSRAGDETQPNNRVCLLPNSVFPSHHIRLEVEFAIKGRIEKPKKEEQTEEADMMGIVGQA